MSSGVALGLVAAHTYGVHGTVSKGLPPSMTLPRMIGYLRCAYTKVGAKHGASTSLMASVLCSSAVVDTTVRDELYKHLDDHALAELWRAKKGRLPPGSKTSSTCGPLPTYNRALLLRKLKEAGIAPDPPTGDEA